MNTLLLAILLVALVPSWRYYRRRPAAGWPLVVGLAAMLVVLAGLRMAASGRRDTPFVPRHVHEAGGLRLGQLAAEVVPRGGAVLVVTPTTDNPGWRRVIAAQLNGVRQGAAGRRLVIIEYDMFADATLTLMQPVIAPETLRAWVAREPDTGAIVSLCGVPVVAPGARIDDLPPFFALSFMDPRYLGAAFRSGLLTACVAQTSIGRELDRRLTPDEIFEKTFELVTAEDVRTGRIEMHPPPRPPRR